MPVELSHDDVRKLTKKLNEFTGREYKHTEILAIIADALGRRPDAMMHELKNEKHPQRSLHSIDHVLPRSSGGPEATEDRTSKLPSTHQASIFLAKESGLEVWTTGGGCMAFGKVLKSLDTPGNDVADIQLMIATGEGTSISAAPDEAVWSVSLDYTDPRGGDSILFSGETELTLSEAIAMGFVFASETDRIWEENYDADAIAEVEGRRTAWNM